VTSRLACFAVTLLLASSALAQRGPAPDPIVREGVTVKLAAHTYVIPDNNVGGVPNVGIVVGSRGTLVIDPGLGRRNGETVLREVGKVSQNAELYFASTHYHPEHTVGYVAFPASAKYVNSRVQEAEFAELGMGMVKTFASRAPSWGELLKDANRRVADITFDRDYTLDLGGVRVRFLVVGPTHTRGDTVFFVEGDNVLFAGDVVMNNSFVAANQSSSVKAWLAAFDSLEKMRPQTIVPAHGAVGEGSLIGVNRSTMQAIQSRTLELKKQGHPVDHVATMVQTEMQAKHPTWGRAQGVAGAARSAYNEGP
jgi:glyoxylase-like metal-dependent hydrolase (beta-lactamase superfamily II)